MQRAQRTNVICWWLNKTPCDSEHVSLRMSLFAAVSFVRVARLKKVFEGMKKGKMTVADRLPTHARLTCSKVQRDASLP